MPPHSRTETRSLRVLQQANAPSAEASSDDISDQLPVSFLAKQPPGLQGRALLTRLLAPGRGEAREEDPQPALRIRGVEQRSRGSRLAPARRFSDYPSRFSAGVAEAAGPRLAGKAWAVARAGQGCLPHSLVPALLSRALSSGSAEGSESTGHFEQLWWLRADRHRMLFLPSWQGSAFSDATVS